MELFSIQNIIIIVLIIIIILSFLGINILIIFAGFVQKIINISTIILFRALSVLGYTTGTVLNTSSDVATNIGKTSLDILNGTIHDVDNILINASKGTMDNAINTQSIRSKQYTDPQPSHSMMPVQNPISSSKINYCLVGEYQSKRGCIEVGENDLCMSGQLFSSKELCLNPNLTSNAQITPFNSISTFPLPPINPLIPNELRP